MNRNDFRRLFQEAFDADDKWLDWFMTDVYDENEVLVEKVNEKAVAMMLSSRYPMKFCGKELSLAYLSCVATAKAERGKGYMRRLMACAIKDSYERSDAFATLIPAERRLYFFYEKFGFASVFYADELRFTAMHSFALGEEFKLVKPEYEMFARLEALRSCAVCHPENRFRQILGDLKLDNGIVRAVTDGNGGEAMVFARVGQEVKVLDLLASTGAAAEAALACVGLETHDKPFVVWAIPSERGTSLHPRAMVRIVNVEAVLSEMAAYAPKAVSTIRVSDPLIDENNGIFSLRKGKCHRLGAAPPSLSLDVSVDVLAKVIFSAPEIGDVFGLPTARPFISLMLD